MTNEHDAHEGERGLSLVFGALANVDRIAIIDMLRGVAAEHPGGVSISRVAEATGLTRFSASRHLRILRDAGLVSATRRRPSVMHRLDARGFDAVEDWLCGTTLGEGWFDAFASLDRPA
ncbi:helix-turn-helix domain-containing protein [Microbacterium sp. zg-Y818]|uniref:ArsR/SmtB family transcription factor n=1 Tax=unclassified Microbacterium TaxID=2609290 RepID=UPI00214BC9DF|nr:MULTISPECIES: helix-turn-helix domain-containing protein [unclassified Microbacterium]MCR2799380.1 helix-turn-helix domain-containing protein [Microbacterium sp. zg.Y818]WIM21379.1 helix-turn-helix domain-containing protein [Microbacterium sp. zg-Y818]